MKKGTPAARTLRNNPRDKSSPPYSSAALFGDIIFTSGALPTKNDGTVDESFAGQVRDALLNLHQCLKASGADWNSVLKINGYVKNIEKLPELNDVYAEVIGPHGFPARTTVQVSSFRGNVQVEFDAIAHRIQNIAVDL